MALVFSWPGVVQGISSIYAKAMWDLGWVWIRISPVGAQASRSAGHCCLKLLIVHSSVRAPVWASTKSKEITPMCSLVSPLLLYLDLSQRYNNDSLAEYWQRARKNTICNLSLRRVLHSYTPNQPLMLPSVVVYWTTKHANTSIYSSILPFHRPFFK